jgi:uncharacterized protein YbjT (DUF2867 family)
MVVTNGRTVTVFGGTGFLGRRIVRHLRYHEFPVRIASRHPDRGHSQFGPDDDPQLQFLEANIQDERSVADALAGAYGVVNAVSLYVEHGLETFHSVHVESAQRVAAQAHRAGVERFVHVSGIGADAASPFRYIRKRGEGELAVRAAFNDALFVRPAVMFGPDDAFLTIILKLLRQLPIYPMFGRGLTRLQLAYVEDVAEAIGRTMQRAETPSTIFEFAGPRVYSYESRCAPSWTCAPTDSNPVCRLECTRMGIRNVPKPALTRNQVELMQIDTVSSPGMPGFVELGISPHSVEAILQKMLSNCG